MNGGMNALAFFLWMLGIIVLVWPKSLGKWIAQVQRGYSDERRVDHE